MPVTDALRPRVLAGLMAQAANQARWEAVATGTSVVHVLVISRVRCLRQGG